MTKRSSSTATKKTQSQKIRSNLYVLWEMKGKKGEFEDYYNKLTDWFIKKIQKEIDNEQNEVYKALTGE